MVLNGFEGGVRLTTYVSFDPVGPLKPSRNFIRTLLSSITPTKEASGQVGSWQGLRGFEAFLGRVSLTTNVPYDPVGPLKPSGTPIRTLLSSTTLTGEAKGWVNSWQGLEGFLGGVSLTTNVPYGLVGPFKPSGEFPEDSSVLHNSNWEGIRTGMVLMGLQAFLL